MNHLHTYLLIGFLFSSYLLHAQNVGVNTATPDPFAALDVVAVNGEGGLLIPRTDTITLNGLAGTIPNSLLIFQTTDNSFYYYDTYRWLPFGSDSAPPGLVNGLIDADGDTQVQVEKNSDDDIIRFDLEGTEHMTMVKNANGTFRTEILANGSNIAFGDDALFSNTTGTSNVATGYRALYANTTGANNVANGIQTLRSNTLGSRNVAMGYLTLQNNTTGNDNVAIGAALGSNISGSNNIAHGREALRSNTGGNHNVAIGNSALRTNTTGSYNVASGNSALYHFNANHNIAIGRVALHGVAGSSTGEKNIAIGDSTLFANTTGRDNIANGNAALRSNTSGRNNIANGQQALYSNTTGLNNVANGNRALFSNTTGYDNLAYGLQSLQANTEGHNNLGLGAQALNSNTTGDLNIAIGPQAGLSATGSRNVFIGSSAGSSETGSNKLYIDNSGAGPVNALIYGEFDNDLLNLNAEVNVKNRLFANKGSFFGPDTGGLPAASGAGVRAFYDSAKNAGSIFAYDYSASQSRNLFINNLGGNVTIGNFPLANYALTVKADEFNSNGGIALVAASGSDYWSINTYSSSDRDLGFWFNGAQRGYLNDAVDAGLIDFTAQHRNIPATGSAIDYQDKIGMIVSSSGSIYNLDGSTMPSISESLPHVQLSEAAYEKSIYGVIAGYEDPSKDRVANTRSYSHGAFGTSIARIDANDYRLIINSGGEGAVWVSNYNGAIENGDLVVTSPIAGIGMKQEDGLIQNYTVAKVVMDCNFDLQSDKYECKEVTHNGKTYRMALIACVYKCN